MPTKTSVSQKIAVPDTAEVREFDPHRVRPLPNQPRKRFRGIPELAESIRTIGQTSAGIVTLVTDGKGFDAQLIDGERRLRACALAGVKFRAEIRGGLADHRRQRLMSLAANFQRQDHDCLEIAHAIAELQADDMSMDDISKLFGKSQGWVGQHLSLLKLCPDVQALLVPEESDASSEVTEEILDEDPVLGKNGVDTVRQPRRRTKLTFSLALLLTSVPPDRQTKMAKKITAESLTLTAARRLLYQEIRDSDVVQKRKRQPSEFLESLHSLIQQSKDRFGMFIDLPGADFKAMLAGLKRDGLKELAEMLKDVANDVTMLSEAVTEEVQRRAAEREVIRRAN